GAAADHAAPERRRRARLMAALLAVSPALPLHTAGKYVVGAYVVLFALVLIYVAIMAIRMSRIERELGELLSEAAGRDEAAAPVEAKEPVGWASCWRSGSRTRPRRWRCASASPSPSPRRATSRAP